MLDATLCHAGRRMKFLSRALFLLFLLLGVLIAVSNTQPVQLALWPLPHVVVLPLYLLVVAAAAARRAGRARHGLVGGAPPSPARPRPASDEVGAAGARDVERLRAGRSRAAKPRADAGGPAPRDQKAIERQSALVAPELSSSGTRGPFT